MIEPKSTDKAAGVKERPILFSGPMVRALLDGRKTQTRRAIKPAPEVFDHQEPIRPEPRGGGAWIFMAYSDRPSYQFATSDRKCPYGVPGDRLWVRENIYQFGGPVEYAADGPPSFPRKLTPSIHMRRAQARITLEITDVRVQRLQDITPEDAIAEGLTRRTGQLETWWGNGWDGDTPDPSACYFLSPVECYRALWNKINGPESWDANPWVWCLTFKRVDGITADQVRTGGR